MSGTDVDERHSVSKDTPGQLSPSKQADEVEELLSGLAVKIDTLVDRARPKTIVQRAKDNIKAKFIDETGAVRMETVVPLAVGTIAVIGGIAVIRRLVK